MKTQSTPSAGRLRLALLLATAAAFLLVPAAGATAAGTLTIETVGPGSGTVSSVGGFVGGGEFEGEPAIDCTWNGSTEENSGNCVSELEEGPEAPGFEAIAITSVTAEPGSELAAFVIVEGEDLSGGKCELLEFSEVALTCFPGVAVGEGNVHATVVFECEGAEPCPPPEEAEVPLEVEVEGEGEVTGEGIACTEGGNGGPECENEFPEGSEPGLTATPAEDWEFTGWETIEGNAGSCEGTATPCEAGPLTEATKLKATFEEEPGTLTIETVGPGSGTVSSVGGFVGGGEFEGEPPIDCTWDGSTEENTGTCETQLVEGAEAPGFEAIAITSVTVEPGSELAAFVIVEGGDLSGGKCELLEFSEVALTCFPGLEVGEGGDVHATVVFEVVGPFTLTVEPAPVGNVHSVPYPPGINCSQTASDCDEEYEAGEEVTLVATQPAGSTFTGWEGCDGPEDEAVGRVCHLVMDEDKTVKATYDTIYKLTVVNTDEGNGNVWSIPFGINCGTGLACMASFEEGTEVLLTATQPAGSKFLGWSGPCTSNPHPRQCVVDMSEDREIEAIYE